MAFKGTKNIEVGKLREEHDSPKRTKGSKTTKKLKKQGLKKFIIEEKTVWALNLKNAIRKINKLKT